MSRAGASILLSVEARGVPKQTQEFGGGMVVVGRDEDCDLVLDAPGVSGRHALIRLGEFGVELVDLSAQGSVVGGKSVHGTVVPLPPATEVQIGPFTIAVGEGPSESGPVAPPSAGGTVSALRPRAGTDDVPAELRREMRRRLTAEMDLARLERNRLNDHFLRAKVKLALKSIATQMAGVIPVGTDIENLMAELLEEVLGLGPLEALLHDPAVVEIMVLDSDTIYVERRGRIERTLFRFTDDEALRNVLERIVTPLGRRIDEASPLVDARLPDGSRVNAVIRPLAVRGTCLTIRKFPAKPLTLDDLQRFGSLSSQMARFLVRTVKARKNILISGGTSSGKTTLLNILSAAIPTGERIVTIEDAAELRLAQPHVVSLESRPPNMEGKGEIPIRALVKNAMRMRPDRVVVGECRGAEALDMMEAMNTGHDGSMTTAHANSPADALRRLETLALMADIDLPSKAIREQLARAIHIIVHQTRFSDGSRRITLVSEVLGLNDDGGFEVQDLFGFRRTGAGPEGRVLGEFYATGRLPTYLGDLVILGLANEEEGYL